MSRWNRLAGVVARELRSLFLLPPGTAPRHGVATRAALSMGVPYTLLLLMGHPDLGLQAGAGAFMTLFAASRPAKDRAKILPFVGFTLLCCAALGVWLVPWPIAFSVGLVVTTVAVCALTFAFRLGPPGAVFFVLVYGLAGNVTAVIDGERLTEPWVFLVAFSSGAAFSYLLAILPLVLPAARRVQGRTLGELLPGPWMGPGEWELVFRIAITATLGTLLTVVFLDPHRAYWTVTAGVAVVGLSASRTFSFGRGLHRTVGTLLGAAFYFIIAPLGSDPWALVLLLPLLQFVIEQIVVRNYAFALVFITPLVFIIAGSGTPGADLEVTAWTRVVDTVIGSVIATATALLHSRRPVDLGLPDSSK